jgi:hypothetical protein
MGSGSYDVMVARTATDHRGAVLLALLAAAALALAALGALLATGGFESDAGGGVAGPGSPGNRPEGVACDRIAALSGDDESGAGTLSRPYETPEGLVDGLASGETGCLRGGTYEFSELLLTEPGITLAPYESERATLRGDIKVLPDAEDATIEGLILNGAGGEQEIGPRIYADGVVLRGNEITNEHTGICVQVARYFDHAPPRGVLIEGNRIHDCGELPPTNHDHGIYLSEARNTIVRDNWIYDNADRGVQQYPDAQGSTIVGNVIYRNGEAINFSGDGNLTSNHNLVTANVIADSQVRWNLYSGADGPDAVGNLVARNCVHAANPDDFYNSNGGIETPSRNFTARENTIAEPEFADEEARDLRLSADSTCADALGSSGRGPPLAP